MASEFRREVQVRITGCDYFYANNITRDVDLWFLTNLAIVMQITSCVTRVKLTIVTNVSQIDLYHAMLKQMILHG